MVVFKDISEEWRQELLAGVLKHVPDPTDDESDEEYDEDFNLYHCLDDLVYILIENEDTSIFNGYTCKDAAGWVFDSIKDVVSSCPLREGECFFRKHAGVALEFIESNKFSTWAEYAYNELHDGAVAELSHGDQKLIAGICHHAGTKNVSHKLIFKYLKKDVAFSLWESLLAAVADSQRKMITDDDMFAHLDT
nr:hypothetical protein TetV2_00630 [Oceanusvirus sp.]